MQTIACREPARGIELDVAQFQKAYGGAPRALGAGPAHRPGEFVAIVGRSGCGKSTLLRLIAGLEASDAGTVSLDGATQTALHADTRIMFQDSRLLPWKRVLDNVALGLPRSEGARALDVLEQVGLAERAHDWPAVLSGGQRQRVALARALVHDPRMMLLDEPLGALDALTRIEMQQLIESLWQQRRFTALLVTHDVAEAMAWPIASFSIEDGCITLDEPVRLPRPRARGNAAFAAIEDRVLQRVLQRPGAGASAEDVSHAIPFARCSWAL